MGVFEGTDDFVQALGFKALGNLGLTVIILFLQGVKIVRRRLALRNDA
ncbi:MAG: hypothetical protein FWG50_02545 [Kiritimatiellaeota bacterium]|nr:hypothetical protein [Kiritimatiellota bacterium]